VNNDRKASWLAIIPDNGLKIEAQAVSEMDSVLRTMTRRAKQADDPDTVEFGRQASQRGGVAAANADKVAVIGERIVKASSVTTPKKCRQVFQRMREANPDMLYAELTNLCAAEVGMSGRQFRKHVPNPFWN
jgi:hypothetical protein